MQEISKENKCANCDLSTKKFVGRYKIIYDEEEKNKYQLYCTKAVRIGSIFCNQCRLIVYRRNERPGCSFDYTEDIESVEIEHVTAEDIEESVNQEIQLIELPLNRVQKTNRYCITCHSITERICIPEAARLQALIKRKIFIPKGNRCCSSHLINNRFYQEDLQRLRIYSNYSYLEVDEISHFFNALSVNADLSLIEKIKHSHLSEEELKTFTGLTWENILFLEEMLSSMRNTESRSVREALIVFMFKLRSGLSNKTIQQIFGMEHEQQVSKYFHQVVSAFEKDILPRFFGINATQREYLIAHETSNVAKKLYNIDDSTLTLIFDGTYIRHQKSHNNSYQRKSYFIQKKTSLCKPFTICTTSGYIVDIAGPFNATMNDASILKTILQESNGLNSLLRPGDIFIVDRGFRDVVGYLQSQGYNVLMPACKGNRSQLTTEESNSTRRITKLRWVVEAIHGAIGQKYKLLHHTLDNKLLPSIKAACRICGYLQNQFGTKLKTDKPLTNAIIDYMNERQNKTETLKDYIVTNNLHRRKKPYKSISSTCLENFPEIDDDGLKILFTGTYQLSQAVCYLAEMMGENDLPNINYLEEQNIIQLKVRSRHVNRKNYTIFIEYSPNVDSYTGIKRYICDCPNGNRTVGCCSHVAAVVYYLANARYKSRIIKPAEILTDIFEATGFITSIEENSDED